MEASEIGKLKPTQIGTLFALSLPLVALPILFIFLIDPQLFEKYDASKLILLGFASAAPIFGIFFATMLGLAALEGNTASGEKAIHNALMAASLSTSLILAMFGFDLLGGVASKNQDVGEKLKNLMVLPIVFSFLSAYTLLIIAVIKNRKRRAKKHPALFGPPWPKLEQLPEAEKNAFNDWLSAQKLPRPIEGGNECFYPWDYYHWKTITAQTLLAQSSA